MIEHTSENALEVEQGSFYPALHRLEDRRWLSSYWGASENSARYDTSEKVAAFYDQLLPLLRSMPGVKAAGIAASLPSQGYGGDSRFAIPVRPDLVGANLQDAIVRGAEPGYFNALGIPLLKGRTFTDGEVLDTARSVILSESFAKRHFPGQDPIGKHIKALDFQGVPPQGFVG